MLQLQLDLAEARVLGHACDNTRSRGSGSDVLALEVANEVGRASAVECTRAAKGVDLASTSQARRAYGVGASAGRGEDLAARGTGVDGRDDVLENVALCNNRCTSADLESVAVDSIPVVVDGVQESVAADLGATAADVVDVVALQGDHVVGASEVHGPVVVTVAGCRPGGGSINLRVGNGDAVAGFATKDNVLAANLGGLEYC